MMNLKTEDGKFPRAEGDWVHSDFRDVTFSYVIPMYEKMVELGKLEK